MYRETKGERESERERERSAEKMLKSKTIHGLLKKIEINVQSWYIYILFLKTMSTSSTKNSPPPPPFSFPPFRFPAKINKKKIKTSSIF